MAIQKENKEKNELKRGGASHFLERIMCTFQIFVQKSLISSFKKYFDLNIRPLRYECRYISSSQNSVKLASWIFTISSN